MAKFEGLHMPPTLVGRVRQTIDGEARDRPAQGPQDTLGLGRGGPGPSLALSELLLPSLQKKLRCFGVAVNVWSRTPNEGRRI